MIVIANRYWIGNTGNWSDTAHWSTTTGGVGGASVPASADNVYFDANSFTLTGQTVTVDVTANCLDMDWTGALNSPTLAGSASLNVSGSLTLVSNMALTYNGLFTFSSTSIGKAITTSGKIFKNGITFSGVGGGWALQDDLTISIGTLAIIVGSFNTNSKNLTVSALSSSGTGIRSIKLNSSTITCSGTWNFSNKTNLTFECDTSTIIFNPSVANTFNAGSLTYYNVTASGTLTTITGSNTFNTLTIAAGKTVNITSGTTQTVTSLVCNGTLANPSTLQSATAASPATIALPAGRYFIRHTSIKDITITGATTVTSIAGTNVSGNIGITFVTKFEMGRIKNDGSFNWYNTSTGTVTKISG